MSASSSAPSPSSASSPSPTAWPGRSSRRPLPVESETQAEPVVAEIARGGLAELHTHLGGSVDPAVMWSLAHEQGIALPVKDYWDFVDLVTVDPRGGERDLDHIIMAAVRGLDRAALEFPRVRAGLILMMDRTFTHEQNEVIVEKAIRYAPRGVVGVDIAGPRPNGGRYP